MHLRNSEGSLHWRALKSNAQSTTLCRARPVLRHIVLLHHHLVHQRAVAEARWVEMHRDRAARRTIATRVTIADLARLDHGVRVHFATIVVQGQGLGFS